MIACDLSVEAFQVDVDEVGRSHRLFPLRSLLKWFQSAEEEPLYVPRADAILPVYVFMYTTNKSG